jgi:glycosyltransferase involved in cell wall biosynthesis
MPDAPSEKWIALLGKRNLPLDGVEDYCTFLAAALRDRGIELQQQRVAWDQIGWPATLRSLVARSADWRGRRVLLQFTSFAWSARGFPFRVLKVLDILRGNGARVAIVFHESSGQTMGPPLIQPLRTACQNYVIRRLQQRAERSVFTIPLEAIPWLSPGDPHAAFIPIGANIPERFATPHTSASPDPTEKTVAVFCFSSDSTRFHEAKDIVFAIQYACKTIPNLHLLLVGRGTDEIGPGIEKELVGTGVRVSVRGTLGATEIAAALSQADVQLFVRGPVSQMRGSVLAGVACGLPIVGYSGAAAGTPIELAGLQLAPLGDRVALASALSSVLENDSLCEDLQLRSISAHKEWFSWDAITERYLYLDAHSPVGSLRSIRTSTVEEKR